MSESLKRAELLFNRIINQQPDRVPPVPRRRPAALRIPEEVVQEISDQHILPFCWTLWHSLERNDSIRAVDFPQYGSGKLRRHCGSLEQMWLNVSLIQKPMEVSIGNEYYLFKSGINPEWEDPYNSRGGHWQFRFSRSSTDSLGRLRSTLVWERLLLRIMTGSLIQDTAPDLAAAALADINGIVISICEDEDMICIWNSNVRSRRVICESVLKVIGEVEDILEERNVHTEHDVPFMYKLHEKHRKRRR